MIETEQGLDWTSLRITLPKRIAEKLLIKEGEFLGFYGEGDKVIVERIA